MPLRIAYFGAPHIGGTYSVLRSLRAALPKYHIEWLSFETPRVIDEQGIDLSAYSSEDDQKKVMRVLDVVAARPFEAVVVNVLSDPPQCSEENNVCAQHFGGHLPCCGRYEATRSSHDRRFATNCFGSHAAGWILQ